MKDVYVLATHEIEPVSEDLVREAFVGDEVEIVFGQDECLFSVRAETSRVDVSFEAKDAPLGWSPDLLVGTSDLRRVLESARGFYRIRFRPGAPHQTVAVFEALWTVRTLMELIPQAVCLDVTAFRLHAAQDVEEITELDFDIRDHVTIHAMPMETGDDETEDLQAEEQRESESGEFEEDKSREGQSEENRSEELEASGSGDLGAMWVHTHGLSKFGTLDVEVFNVREEDLPAAETFLHELCTDLAFGQGPAQRAVVSTSVGRAFILVPSEEARTNLPGVDPVLFEGHDAQMVAVVSPEGKHSMSDMLGQYRERFEEETEEQAAELKKLADRLMPLFKQRFLRKGLMEPLAFVVRAPFEVHPDGVDEAASDEQLWAEIIKWEDDKLIARLVDGGETTTEWRKGAHVEIDESQINALAVTRDGRTLDAQELERLLQAELPA
jgi:hypothetical protein